MKNNRKFTIHSRKNADGFLLKYCDLSVAKVCKFCRSRQELSNEYSLANIGVDTAENDLLEVWGNIQFIIQLPPRCQGRRVAHERAARRTALYGPPARGANELLVGSCVP